MCSAYIQLNRKRRVTNLSLTPINFPMGWGIQSPVADKSGWGRGWGGSNSILYFHHFLIRKTEKSQLSNFPEKKNKKTKTVQSLTQDKAKLRDGPLEK